MKKVLILGGGFAGVEAAIDLRKEKYDVTLVSDRDYLFMFPTSIWIPTRTIEFENVCLDLNALKKAHGFELIIDKVTAIRAKDNEVELENGGVLKDYDYLIVAFGAHKMKHPGIEHTLSICGAPDQALKLRDRLDELIEKGGGTIAMGFGGNPKDPSAVRGGPAFELLFNVHHYLKQKKLREKFELVFFAPMEQPGKKMGDKALEMMDFMFTRANIKQRVGTKIKTFEKDAVVFADDSRLGADLIMFIAAGDGHAVIKASDLPQNDAGFVKIDDYCQVTFDGETDISNVYAVGDAAALEGPAWRAKQGHTAEVMARNAAFNIIARDQGREEREGYQKHLNILCVMDSGDGAAFVLRDDKRAWMLPMPIFGHWMKKGWGWYARNSKLGKIPRLPGM